MKVAIIGAGIAGLCCAIELEKRGIKPDIFEQRYMVGDLNPLSASMLDIGLIPVNKQLKYLEEQWELRIQPLKEINTLVINSPNNSYRMVGNFGHLVKLGQDKDSVHQQLARRLKTSVKYQAHVDYFKIKNKYNHVVLADGSVSIPILLGVWEPKFEGWVRGANIVGKFDPTKIEIWVDREFAREGFAYLTPLNEKAANLVLLVNGLSRQELHDYWDTFMNKIPYEFNDTGFFELEFKTGRVKKHQVGNTLLTGHAGGFVEALWGQSIFASAISGIHAARSIAGGQSYADSVKKLVEANECISRLHQSLNRLDNKGLDVLFKMLKTPGVKQMLKMGNKGGIMLLSSLITRVLGEDHKGNQI